LITRYRHYIRNVGPARAISNTALLCIFVYIVVKGSMAAGNTLVTVFALAMVSVPIIVGMCAPLLLLGLFVRNASKTMQLIRLLQVFVFGTLLVLLIFRPPVPWWGWLGMLGVVSFLHGLVFWFMSDPRTLTERGMNALYGTEPGYDEQDPAPSASS
jgi:hypothetical protein